MDNLTEGMQVIFIGLLVASFLLNTHRVLKAIELCKECLIFANNKAVEKEQRMVNLFSIGLYRTMVKGYRLIYDHTSAIECCKNLLVVLRKYGGQEATEGQVTFELATFYRFQSKHKEAKCLYEEALSIMIKIGDREGEASCYGIGLGTVFECLCEYGKAEACFQKALAIRKEIGDRLGEATAYINLGSLCRSLREHGKAEIYLQKALVITKEIGNRKGEALCYGNLGPVFTFFGEYAKAEEYLQKSLAIRKEIGDRQGEAADHGHLGTVFLSLGEYSKAEEHLRKAIEIRKEVGDKEGEAADYKNLATVFRSLSEYNKAENYLQKSLEISKDISDRKGEALSYTDLGTVFTSLGKYGKAEEYYQKALAITKEIGDRGGEALHYGNLGTLFHSLGEYVKAEEYLLKSLAIRKEFRDKDGEASCYTNLGAVCQSVIEYAKAEEYLQRALAIRKEIGDKPGEGACYGSLGAVFLRLDEYAKAEDYFQRALAIRKEIGDKRGEATDYGNLGTLFRYLGECAKARDYHMKALTMGKEIGIIEDQFTWHVHLTWDMLLEGNVHEAISNLFESITKSEHMRTFLSDSDRFKILFLDKHVFPYQMLSALFCSNGNVDDALYVVELGRARALADLMSVQYSVEKQIPVNPQSWVGIEKVMKKESACVCLYISYFIKDIFFWILRANKPILLRRSNVNDCFINRGVSISRTVDEVFGNETFRRFHSLPQEHCEDRSLFPSSASQPTQTPSQEADSLAVNRLVEEEEDENQQPDPSLAECYKIIIAPVADLLDEPELIIVPDRCLYKVPFAALTDENGKPLSENFRIRIVPSLTTLKLIQDCPADFHSQTGALIVGEPKVSQVFYKGCIETLCPLPSARKEAEMIGQLLGTQPLLGEHATKQAVLQSIHSVGLIHFAAHGNADRGEIALAPLHPPNGIPEEEDYLLTMSDISKVQLRAKLVVLSCCHSAHGQIRSEGVIGIARAFLGSGARSVLVALWALEDKATAQFMGRFYEHLVCGESASESLYQAMKWIRDNGYSARDWAPFILIGDNVTFTDFGT